MSRPRSKEAHRKVLEAAVSLFSERGIDATSMDAIAAESGVSKATIYKHWPDKDHLALEVFAWLYGLDEKRREIPLQDLRSDLIATLGYRPPKDRTELKERLMPHVIAYSARNQIFGRAWRERVVSVQRDHIRRVLDAANARGELDSQLDFDAAIALLVGPMLYRQIFIAKKRTDKAPIEFVEQIVDAFRKSFGSKPAQSNIPTSRKPR